MEELKTMLLEMRREIGELRTAMTKSPINPSEPDSYSCADVAKMFGKTAYTLREHARLGRIKSVKEKYSNRVRIPREEVERLRATDFQLFPIGTFSKPK